MLQRGYGQRHHLTAVDLSPTPPKLDPSSPAQEHRFSKPLWSVNHEIPTTTARGPEADSPPLILFASNWDNLVVAKSGCDNNYYGTSSYEQTADLLWRKTCLHFGFFPG
ncbi:unnamed protein product [Cuscuta campestris]|uniref:Uncharacterized protein n=1 Tax=Cuscuta campestris TaxID=132261 RepID=A0A484LL83_9ASTE|nr:unnamed protein product [Cuscuta campestris]